MTVLRYEILDVENLSQLIERLNQNVGKRMILIAGYCSAYFDGRIKSTLEGGERLLIIKHDLSILMHGPEGVKPLNWQKPHAGPIKFRISKNAQLEMFTQRTKTKEILIISFSKVLFSILWYAHDDTKMSIYGDESDLVKYLVKHPEVIEKGLAIIQTEYNTEVGPVDIRAQDKNGKDVIIEVKKRQATPADAHQLKRYIEYFQERLHKNTRGILVAPSFPNQVIKYLDMHKLEYKEVPWSDIFPVLTRTKTTKLNKFFEEKKD
ncbi:MAG: endonuclease NucS domain-containing protein [Candidatus Heimdallarchaeaceae archaeon]